MLILTYLIQLNLTTLLFFNNNIITAVFDLRFHREWTVLMIPIDLRMNKCSTDKPDEYR